jgi:hypothetical protein
VREVGIALWGDVLIRNEEKGSTICPIRMVGRR